MLNPSTVVTPIGVRDHCPNCQTRVVCEDHDGWLACPDCGWPLTNFDLASLEDWSIDLTTQPDPLDEAGWAHLLATIDQLAVKEAE